MDITVAMFEKGKITSHDRAAAGFADPAGMARMDSEGNQGTDEQRKVEALRSIEWSELAARLNAARDLRRELREDSVLLGGSSGASFGDAAARFFATIGEEEQTINHDDLDGRKASCDRDEDDTAQAFGGDERKQ